MGKPCVGRRLDFSESLDEQETEQADELSRRVLVAIFTISGAATSVPWGTKEFQATNRYRMLSAAVGERTIANVGMDETPDEFGGQFGFWSLAMEPDDASLLLDDESHGLGKTRTIHEGRRIVEVKATWNRLKEDKMRVVTEEEAQLRVWVCACLLRVSSKSATPLTLSQYPNGNDRSLKELAAV